MEVLNLKITLIDGGIPGIVTQREVKYTTPGFGHIVLNIDGEAAKALRASVNSTTAETLGA